MKEYKIPREICGAAKEYMEDVLCKLYQADMIDETDYCALDMLARNYSLFIQATKQMEKEGTTYVTANGDIKKHPAVLIAKDAQVQATNIMKEFGLTPKSRNKMPKMEKAEDSPIEALIKRKTNKETR